MGDDCLDKDQFDKVVAKCRVPGFKANMQQLNSWGEEHPTVMALKPNEDFVVTRIS